MHSALRITLYSVGIGLGVMISYLLSCLMGSTYDPLQLWLSGGVGLIIGLGFSVRTWLRDRAARR